MSHGIRENFGPRKTRETVVTPSNSNGKSSRGQEQQLQLAIWHHSGDDDGELTP